MADQTSIVSSDKPIEIPPPTGVLADPFSARKLVRLMGFFGPAAVVASLSLGAGETIMVTGLGSWAGYRLLWLLLLSVLVKGIFVTYLIGHYTAVTGQPIGHRLVKLPGPRGWLLLLIVIAEVGLISMGLTTVAKPCGNLISYLHYEEFNLSLEYGTWENLWTSILMAAALSFGLFCSYKTLERQQIFICGLLVVGTISATIMVRPDLGSLFFGAISFGDMPTPPEWAPPAARNEYYLNLVTIFAYVGGSLSGYLAYSHWISLKGWGLNSHPDIDRIRARANAGTKIDYLPDDPEQAKRMHVLLTPIRWDVGMGGLVLFIVTAAFMASGAAVLFPQQTAIGDDKWELLTKQASIWQTIHQGFVPVYYVAVLVALWGTLASIPEAITRVVHEFLSAIWPRFESFPMRRLQCIIVAWFFATAMLWTWTNVSFDLLTQLGSFISLNVGLLIVCVCVVYFNSTLPKRYRPSRWILAGGVLSAVVLLMCLIGGAIGLASKLVE